MVSSYCLIDGKDVLKRYLDPSQCIESKRGELVTVIWIGENRKKDVEYTPGKKTIIHDGKEIKVDGEVKVKG